MALLAGCAKGEVAIPDADDVDAADVDCVEVDEAFLRCVSDPAVLAASARLVRQGALGRASIRR